MAQVKMGTATEKDKRDYTPKKEEEPAKIQTEVVNERNSSKDGN